MVGLYVSARPPTPAIVRDATIAELEKSFALKKSLSGPSELHADEAAGAIIGPAISAEEREIGYECA